jgi:Transposase DDE domain group 1
MTECIAPIRVFRPRQLPLLVEFDAPEISSDAGWVLLHQLDEQLGVTAGFAACLRDDREPGRVRHSRSEQVRQRVFQIAAGYEDCNDADRLRQDPLLKTVCDRTPHDAEGLSSQPTLSRLDNSADGPTLRRLLRHHETRYVASLPVDQEVVILDIDSTADTTYGAQQLSFFNAHYDEHIYHPLLVFDGESGELITARLRPGNAGASRGAAGILRRLIRKIRRHCPQAQIVVRGDAGFCVPKLLRVLDRLNTTLGGVDYLLGMAKNPRLLRQLETTQELARELSDRRSGEKVARFTSFAYAAHSWKRARRLIGKAEHSRLGANPRFVVTSLEEFDPETLYRAYGQRGRCELYIKDFKNALQSDRLSCSAFRANFFRLLLHAAAYQLMQALRREVASEAPTLGRAQFDTLRLRLLKVAALVHQNTRRIRIQLPRAYPHAASFRNLLAHLSLEPVPT